jgi:hypothetical protein
MLTIPLSKFNLEGLANCFVSPIPKMNNKVRSVGMSRNNKTFGGIT